MLRVGVDMDGIIVDIQREFCQRFNEMAPPEARIGPADLRHWHFEDCVPPGWREAATKMVRSELLDMEFFWTELPLLSARIPEYLQQWNSACELHLVSAPWGTVSASAKTKWVRRHLPFLHADQLNLVPRKHLVKLDLLVDDKASTLRSYRKHWPEARLASVRYPYHDDPKDPVPPGTLLADSYLEPDRAWDQLHEWVMEMIYEQ